jgi:hypothetical protein
MIRLIAIVYLVTVSFQSLGVVLFMLFEAKGYASMAKAVAYVIFISQNKTIYAITPPIVASAYMFYSLLTSDLPTIRALTYAVVASAVLYLLCWIVLLYVAHLMGAR